MTPISDDMVERIKAILSSKRRVNIPHPACKGLRIVGWIVDEEIAGLSDGLFAVEEIERRAAALEGSVAVPAWQDISTAPKDGTQILALVSPHRGKYLEHHAGRAFVIRHEGKTTSGYDLGWAVYPGFGGASDSDFACWQPLPTPPITRQERGGAP